MCCWSVRRFSCLIGLLDFWEVRLHTQQRSALIESSLAITVGEKAVVADPHEAVWQDVEQETTDKLESVEGQQLFSVPIGVVFPAEGDLAVQPAAAEGPRADRLPVPAVDRQVHVAGRGED